MLFVFIQLDVLDTLFKANLRNLALLEVSFACLRRSTFFLMHASYLSRTGFSKTSNATISKLRRAITSYPANEPHPEPERRVPLAEIDVRENL